MHTYPRGTLITLIVVMATSCSVARLQKVQTRAAVEGNPNHQVQIQLGIEVSNARDLSLTADMAVTNVKSKLMCDGYESAVQSDLEIMVQGNKQGCSIQILEFSAGTLGHFTAQPQYGIVNLAERVLFNGANNVQAVLEPLTTLPSPLQSSQAKFAVHWIQGSNIEGRYISTELENRTEIKFTTDPALDLEVAALEFTATENNSANLEIRVDCNSSIRDASHCGGLAYANLVATLIPSKYTNFSGAYSWLNVDWIVPPKQVYLGEDGGVSFDQNGFRLQLSLSSTFIDALSQSGGTVLLSHNDTSSQVYATFDLALGDEEGPVLGNDPAPPSEDPEVYPTGNPPKPDPEMYETCKFQPRVNSTPAYVGQNASVSLIANNACQDVEEADRCQVSTFEAESISVAGKSTVVYRKIDTRLANQSFEVSFQRNFSEFNQPSCQLEFSQSRTIFAFTDCADDRTDTDDVPALKASQAWVLSAPITWQFEKLDVEVNLELSTSSSYPHYPVNDILLTVSSANKAQVEHATCVFVTDPEMYASREALLAFGWSESSTVAVGGGIYSKDMYVRMSCMEGGYTGTFFCYDTSGASDVCNQYGSNIGENIDWDLIPNLTGLCNFAY